VKLHPHSSILLAWHMSTGHNLPDIRYCNKRHTAVTATSVSYLRSRCPLSDNILVILYVVFSCHLECRDNVCWIVRTKITIYSLSIPRNFSPFQCCMTYANLVVVKLTNMEKRATETKKRFMWLSHKHSNS
jgi:hypothetical protein